MPTLMDCWEFGKSLLGLSALIGMCWLAWEANKLPRSNGQPEEKDRGR